jgi:peptidoglycan/LPS O-acetylase OafA/YrhL
LIESPYIRSRVCELDGLRGVAILMVLLWHYSLTVVTVPGSAAAYAMKIFGLCWAGVDLFFVLSGYLIGGLLIDAKSTSNMLSSFYVRRACRILPLYLLLLLLSFLLTEWVAKLPDRSTWSWLLDGLMPLWTYFLFVQNFAMAYRESFGGNMLGITWSLAVEEQFYVLIPLVVWLCTLRQLFWVCVAGVLLAVGFRVLLLCFVDAPYVANYVLLAARCDALLLGVLVALVVRTPSLKTELRERVSLLKKIVVILGAALIALTAIRHGLRQQILSLGGYTLIAVFVALILLLLVTGNLAWLKRCLKNRLLVYCGQIAFGLYLLHQPIRGVTHAVVSGAAPSIGNLAEFAVSAIALVVTFLVAGLSWRYLESPIIARGKRFTSSRQLAEKVS